jgi:hypothetical protein
MAMLRRIFGAAFLTLALASPVWAQDEAGEEPDAATETDEPEDAAEPAMPVTVNFTDVQAGALAAYAEATGESASDQQVIDLVNYVIGMSVYVVYHEFGHALIQELQLPVIGTEEDSVDIFAAIYMIAEDEDPVLDDMIGSVVEARFDQDDAAGGFVAGWDAHSGTEQRAFQVLCMLVGADYEGWHDPATESEMPEQRQKDCAWEYAKAEKGWDTLLGPNELENGEVSPASVTVEFGEPLPEHQAVAAMIEASGIGEAIAQHIESQFRLPNPITLKFYSCGELMADWTPQTRTARLCYEYVESFRQNFLKRHAAATPQ